jgi:hypothetical protein
MVQTTCWPRTGAVTTGQLNTRPGPTVVVVLGTVVAVELLVVGPLVVDEADVVDVADVVVVAGRLVVGPALVVVVLPPPPKAAQPRVLSVFSSPSSSGWSATVWPS